MQIFSHSKRFLSVVFILFVFAGCASTNDFVFYDIEGFNEKANAQLEKFIEKTKDAEGRKIAVFDGDGTVLGQAPHYLADECMYMYAKKNPGQRPELIEKMKGQSNVSLPYVQNRVKFIAGMSLQDYRDMGEECFEKYYSNKIYEPMRRLINLLKKNSFEIWIVTASPEGMYQQFLSKAFAIPITNIIGVKSIIRDGIITDEIVHPIPQDEGKMEAIETFIQDKPLLVAGNSRGDKEMIEFSKDLKIIVNPDEHIAEDQTESIAEYAEKNDWLIVRIKDVPNPDFPYVSSQEYGIRLNKTNDVK